MRNVVTAAGIAFCLFSALLVGAFHTKGGAAPRDGLRLHERVAALERLGSRLEARLEELSAALERGSEPALREAAAAEASDVQGVVAQASDRSALEDWDEGRLRALVSRLVEEAHAERRRRERRAMTEWSAARARLRTGPYGRHNYEVNAVGERLELSEGQKAWYNDLLEDYAGRLHALPAGGASRDAASRELHAQSTELLEEEFAAAVRTGLTGEQWSAFEALPPWLGRVPSARREDFR